MASKPSIGEASTMHRDTAHRIKRAQTAFRLRETSDTTQLVRFMKAANTLWQRFFSHALNMLYAD
jgi:hypothetical protein